MEGRHTVDAYRDGALERDLTHAGETADVKGMGKQFSSSRQSSLLYHARRIIL